MGRWLHRGSRAECASGGYTPSAAHHSPHTKIENTVAYDAQFRNAIGLRQSLVQLAGEARLARLLALQEGRRLELAFAFLTRPHK